jgi:hypothetical protein
MGVVDIILLFAGIIVGILATAGFGVLSLTPAEFRIARGCFWAAALGLAGIAILWGSTTESPLWARLMVTGIIGAVAVAGLTEALRWVQKREHAVAATGMATFPQEPLPEVSHEQYVELKEIATLCSKDEAGLLAEFDFLWMIQFNSLMWKKVLFPNEKFDDYSKMLAESNAGPYRFDSRFMSLTKQPGGTIIAGPPKGLYYMVESKKNVETMARLDSFLSSVLVPSDVKSATQALKAIAEQNRDVTFDVLNERYTSNPKNFSAENEPRDPLNGNIYNAYRKRLKPMQPAADKIVAEIREFLRIH